MYERRLKLNKLAMMGLILISLFIFMAIIGTNINGFKYYEQDYSLINQHPMEFTGWH